jgi:hypothetical protein
MRAWLALIAGTVSYLHMRHASQMAGVMPGWTLPAAHRGWAGMSADGKFGSHQCATVRSRADVE